MKADPSSIIITAIENKTKLRHNGKDVENIKIINVILDRLTPCENPNSNYEFDGQCTIRKFIPTENGNDYQEFLKCVFNGLALVNEDEAEIIILSVRSGLPNFI